MKKIFSIFFLFVFINKYGYSQQCLAGGCSNFNNQYPAGSFTPTTSWSTLSSMNGGNWTLFNVICGNTYDFTYCETYGGVSTGWDAQLTLYNYGTGALLCYSNDNCGSTGKGPYIRWTSTFTGTVRLLSSALNCQNNGPTGPYNKLAYRIATAPTSTITVTAYNINNTVRSNARIVLYNYDYSQIIQTVYTNGLGQATFNPLNNGTYNFEVYYTPSGNSPPISTNEEFWGSQSFSICSAGQSIPITFTRNQPYIVSNPSFSPTSFSVGQTSNGNFPIRNALPYSTSSYISLWVDRNQISPWDYNNSTSSQTINANATANFSLNNIAPTNTGVHYYYALVYSFVNNQYIVTDQYAWTNAFTVTCPALSTPSSPSPGAISGPGTVLPTLTPTFTWAGNSSGIYHIQIWDAATNPANASNVIYGFETPTSSPGHCISGLSHTIPPGVLVDNGLYKWSVHRNDPCGECESSPTSLLYFQVSTSSCSAPTAQSSNIVFLNNDGVSVTASWSNGNGTNRIVKVNTINSFTNPINGIAPVNINSSYQGSGEQIVYYGSGNSVYVNGLLPGQTYYFRVYESNCSGSQIFYNSSTNALNPNSVQMQVTGQLPVANFYTSTPTIIVGQNATFFDQSSNTPTSWDWLVERQLWNGSYTGAFLSSQQNPTFTFSSATCYRVTLTATNAAGSNSLTRSCYIYVKPDLTAPIPSDVTRAQKYYTYKGGDPVNLANGSFSFSMKDFSIPGVKTRVNLERRYFSNSSYESVFGVGWHHSFDVKVDFSNVLEWIVQYPDGHNEHYAPYQNGETRSLYPGNYDTLYYTNSGNTLTAFTLIQKDGKRWDFNGTGNISAITDLDGNQTLFNYSSGKLNSVTLPGGRSLQFTYNGFNKVSSVSDNSNRTVYYYYDITGHYLDSTRIVNSTTSFRYGPYGMTEVYDPRGNRIVQNLFNAQGQVYEQYDAENKKTTFQYNTPSTGMTTVTDPLLKNRVIKHDDKSRCVEVKDELNNLTKYGYSLNNTLDTITDARNFQTIFVHDEKGNTKKTINAKGYSDSTDFTSLSKPNYIKDKEGNVYKIQYNSSGNPTHKILPTNDTIKIAFDNRGLDTLITDAKGNKTRKAFNVSGDLIQTISPTSVTQILYDAVGRPIEITDSYGRKDSLFWNYFDQLIKKKDKMGRVEEFGYDKNGNQVSYKDKKGQITTTVYNKFDKPIRVIQPQNHITEYEYDDSQRKRKVRDPNKNVLIFNSDNAGRIISIVDSVLGTINQKSYDAVGNIITVTDAEGKVWTNRVDEINRVTSIVNPLGDSIQFKYNKNNLKIEEIDEEGKSTKWDYDAESRHFKTTDARNNYVQLFLNKNGLTDSIRDARGNIRNKATYDGSDRLVSLNDGFGNYLMTWDSTGIVKTITDPDNRILSHFYNANSELVDIRNGNTTLRHYLLDDNGNYINATSGTQTASVIRNQLGWITNYTDSYSNEIQHTYDSIGNVKTVIYPGGKLVEYKYNSLNKCIEVKDWANNIFTIARNHNSDITSISYSNGYKTEIVRDDASRVMSWVNKDAANTIFQSNLVRRDKTGNLIKDSGLHVLSFTPASQFSSGTYGRDDRLISYGNAVCTTNASGQRTHLTAPAKAYSYIWSFMSELDSTTQTTMPQVMQYNAFNERVTKSTTLGTTRYVVDHNLARFPLILQERNGANQEIVSYLYIPGEGIALDRDSAGTFRYYHHDIKGNVIALSDIAGQITDRYEYTEFGDSVSHIGGSIQQFTWMGMYGIQHEGNSLYYLHARYYDGKTGSFISKDPYPVNYLNTQDVNRYVYGYNNPMRFIDPTGLIAQNNISYEEGSWVRDGFIDALEKISEGKWVGTGYVKNAYDYYEQEYIQSILNGKANNWYLLGLGAASLGTPENYQTTLGALTLEYKYAGEEATRLLGKTGYLRIFDMRTLLGRTIKKLWGIDDAMDVIEQTYNGIYEKRENFRW